MSDPFGGQQLAIPFSPVADLLAAYRARDAKRLALVDIDQDVALNFAELEARVTDIAAHLKARGLAKASRIVLLSDECIEKLLIWFAAWRIGAVICPLNIELNAQHISTLTAAIAPALILIHKDLDAATLAKGARAPVLRFGPLKQGGDEFFAGVARGADPASLPERNGPLDMSCIFCTSGTTDRPKIVVYDHVAYWLNGLSTIDFLGLTADDNALEYRSFGWNSAQVLSLMPFLQLGTTLHIARRFSHSRFFDWIRKYKISFAAGVPTVINMMLNKPLDIVSTDIPSLRLMSSSSAPLSPEQWVRFEKMYGITLLQAYGMSEVGWICGNRHYRRRIGTVGPPVKHQQFAILDAEGKPCPTGIEGEIAVTGPQSAIGLMQDDGTLEPVRGRWIKSGDLAAMDEDGFVRITGRAKDLIIRGGANISPVEVDGVLLAAPGVLDAASVGVPDPIYGEEVVGFAVLKPGSGADAESVLAFCAEKLPLPKRPKKLFIVDELPKSDRGKVLRDRLREKWLELTAPPPTPPASPPP